MKGKWAELKVKTTKLKFSDPRKKKKKYKSSSISQMPHCLSSEILLYLLSVIGDK